jgi:hypothetical protein
MVASWNYTGGCLKSAVSAPAKVRFSNRTWFDDVCKVQD